MDRLRDARYPGTRPWRRQCHLYFYPGRQTTRAQQQRARATGLGVAVFSRILLLLSLSWVIGLTEPLFSVFKFAISGRDLILIVGGLFLLGKSTHEIHQRMEGVEGHASTRVKPSFASVIVQVLLLDVVFSLDSVITAVGMVERIQIMVAAVVIAAVVMIVSAGPISRFVDHHPTVKMLALAFLLLIGFTLIVEGLHQHIPKGNGQKGETLFSSFSPFPLFAFSPKTQHSGLLAQDPRLSTQDYVQSRSNHRSGDGRLLAAPAAVPLSWSCPIVFGTKFVRWCQVSYSVWL
jgi:predicted tellurium resistance membrane protein TerC